MIDKHTLQKGVITGSSNQPGYLRGRHYTTYMQDVNKLKGQFEFLEVEKLLLELIDAIETESKADDVGVAPWYYEELAKVYRRIKDFNKELDILERFAKQQHAPGVKPKKLLERLDKTNTLLAKEK